MAIITKNVPCPLSRNPFPENRCYFCNRRVSAFQISLPYSPGVKKNFCAHCLAQVAWLPINFGVYPLNDSTVIRIPLDWFIDDSLRYSIVESFHLHEGWPR